MVYIHIERSCVCKRVAEQAAEGLIGGRRCNSCRNPRRYAPSPCGTSIARVAREGWGESSKCEKAEFRFIDNIATPTPALPRCGLRPAGEGEFRFYPQTLNRLSERPGGNARFFYSDTCQVLYRVLGGLRYSALTGQRAAI